MKKIAVLLSTILSATVILSGCGSVSKGTQETGSSDKSTGEPYVVKYAFQASGQIPKDTQIVADEISKITLKKINVKVELLPLSPSQYTQQINLMISGNEKLDLMTEAGSNISGDVAKNQLVQMDSYLKKDGSGITKALGDYMKAGTINGKQYSVPCIRNMGNSYGIVMRKDILDKYRIDPATLKTNDDVEAMFKTIHAGEPNLALAETQGSGSSLYNFVFPGFDNLGDGYGILTNSGQKDLKVTDLFETTEYANDLKYIRKWYQAGYVLKDLATNSQAGNTLVKSGKAFSEYANLKPGFDNQATNACGTPMVSATLVQPFATTRMVNTYSIGIPVTCKNPDKTMQFLNLMYTDPQVINLIDWGIEGKHYTKVSGTTNVIDYPAGVTAANTGYGLNMGYQFGNQMLSYVWNGDSPDLYTKLAAFNKSAKLSKAFGFTFDASSVKTEYAAITNVCNQYKLGLEDGQLDPETNLPKFISALKDAGIDKYVAAKQTQLDAWAKTKK